MNRNWRAVPTTTTYKPGPSNLLLGSENWKDATLVRVSDRPLLSQVFVETISPEKCNSQYLGGRRGTDLAWIKGERGILKGGSVLQKDKLKISIQNLTVEIGKRERRVS